MSQTFTVRGMKCGSCEQTIEETLESAVSVDTVSADHQSDTVTVEGDVGETEVVAAIERTEYDIAV